MISKTIMALINALQTCKSFAPANPVDISAELHRWELAENYDATTISVFDATGQTIYDNICKIYTRYADIRIDDAGLRIGECCGLKWSDISGHYLQVNRQADNDGVREWTKTDSSRREIYSAPLEESG